MVEHDYQFRHWGGWWYLEQRSRILGNPWSAWRHFDSNPSKGWLREKHPMEARYAAKNGRG